MLESLLSVHFMKLLVRNVSLQKNQLHEAAVQLKDTLLAFIASSNLSSAFSLKLLKQSFGPNSNLRFSTKRNQDLLKVITPRLEKDQISEYFSFLLGQFNHPNIEEHFP